jgi:hypothetical protein
MTFNRLTNTLLAVIALFLGMIAFRPFLQPPPVHGQSSPAMQSALVGFSVITPLNTPSLAPGQSFPTGIILLDQATGNVWGYPMLEGGFGSSAPLKSNPGPPVLYGTFNGAGQGYLATAIKLKGNDLRLPNATS